jgi:proton-dependent oligopeptide transporter, POT family
VSAPSSPNDQKSPLQEIVQPFIDLVHAPRALWGINLAYFLEGLVYFGMLGYLAMHFSDFILRGVEHTDVWSHRMVMVLTAGITISMFFLGFVADKWGVRRALILAFCLLLTGRIIMCSAPTMGLQPQGLWSPLHLTTMAGILFVVVGYGMYQPAAYAAVRQFTTPKTAGMGFAMLYALMNLGGYVPSAAFMLRDEEWLGLGIVGTFWIYTSLTLVALLCTVLILSSKTVLEAVAAAKEETERIKSETAEPGQSPPTPQAPAASELKASETVDLSAGFWAIAVMILITASAAVYWRWQSLIAAFAAIALVLAYGAAPGSWRNSFRRWVKYHPLSNARFAFFIFALMPVQTLFTYNWFILPQYVSRAYTGWIGKYFEIASNLNPLLVFILVPIIAAVTQKRKVYNMMIAGTFIMAAPAFLLAIKPTAWTLFGYIVIMTIGEAMWQPRFLQYAAEIAPPGRTGQYMGVAQLPWFMTKLLVPLIYSGTVMEKYCPAEGQTNTEVMWLIFGCIAICSFILLMLGKNWVGKDFKTRSDG